jgi:hypothetical protein
MRITAIARSLSSGAVGLVGQDHRRVVDQSARDGHPLLLAARQLRGHGACAVLHVQRAEQFDGTLACLRVGHTGQHGQQRHVVGDVEEGNQVGRLEHEADAVAAQCAQVADLPALVVDPFVAQGHAAGAGIDHRTQAFSARCSCPTPRGPIRPTTSPGATSMFTPLERVDGGVAAAVALAQGPLDADAAGVHINLLWLRPGRRAAPCGWR